MNKSILSAITKGDLILFLGAGASANCKNRELPILMSGDLARQMADLASLPYDNENLDVVYEAAREILGARLDQFLESSFNHITPSADYDTVAKYVWRRIYTLNIDTGLDRALTRLSNQNINKLSASDPYVDPSPFFENLEYIKLNGTADRIQDGVIFSASEYAKATASHLPWYSQCASDFVRSPILFIGTQLNEPLLKYHIERYKTLNPTPQGVSYLIARSATAIQIAALKRYKIEFIPGTLSDFTSWLSSEVPVPPRPFDVAQEKLPQLKDFSEKTTEAQDRYAELFEHVKIIKREAFDYLPKNSEATIKDFYKGFKPTWNDIVEGIPAKLDVLDDCINKITNINIETEKKLIPLIGPAGSGKATLVKQICHHFCLVEDWEVFFIEGTPDNLLETLVAIEQASKHSKIIVGIESIEFLTEQLLTTLSSRKLSKTLLIASERESTWNRRARHSLQDFYQSPVYVREFSSNDAEKILLKLEQYGSWTRLGRMSNPERTKELLNRSKKQLLIALLEATLGRGFERIIEEEFSAIKSDEEKVLLAIVTIITDRRSNAPITLIDRALEKISILSGATVISSGLAGIIHHQGGTMFARHPVYARFLIERSFDPSLTAKALNAVLQAFSDYKSPVIRHLKKTEATIYKSLINHKFLFESLKGKQDLVIGTYSKLEKKFESDGLFWLQYGLSLRDFNANSDALEKLKIAKAAYSMPHTLHALGQQLLISALETTHESAALSLADEAREILERLDETYESDDTYPIVTLAEGHTSVVRKFSEESDARNLANYYSRKLEIRSKQKPEYTRLKLAYERMFKYAATGIWQDTNGSVGK
ncbi:SIR2 family protein [Pseudomonas bubulae]|uniref:P-loop NTPase n=1 Tax=Pseudomonas bubulae TaxID=2316085 RepID=UPI001F33B24D|nr:SIR2 family protein [Pseudomonas bubulae]MCF3194537.1 SIR2 family protein [Pseudomonas bubulae]